MWDDRLVALSLWGASFGLVVTMPVEQNSEEMLLVLPGPPDSEEQSDSQQAAKSDGESSDLVPYYPKSIWDCYNRTLRDRMQSVKGFREDGELQVMNCLEQLAEVYAGRPRTVERQKKTLNCWDPVVRYSNLSCGHFFKGSTEVDLTPVFLVFVIMAFIIIIICLSRIRKRRKTPPPSQPERVTTAGTIVLETPSGAHHQPVRLSQGYHYQDLGWYSPGNMDTIPSYNEAVRVKSSLPTATAAPVYLIPEPPSYSEAAVAATEIPAKPRDGSSENTL